MPVSYDLLLGPDGTCDRVLYSSPRAWRTAERAGAVQVRADTVMCKKG